MNKELIFSKEYISVAQQDKFLFVSAGEKKITQHILIDIICL